MNRFNVFLSVAKRCNNFFLIGILSSIILAFSGFSLLNSSTIEIKDVKSKQLSEEERDMAFQRLSKAISVIEDSYVNDISVNEIIDKAISGLLANLDAHSSYLQKKDFEELRSKTSGSFSGIGIQVGMKDGALTIIAPIDDTPGQKAGLKNGDIILKVDSKPTLDMNLDQAVTLMKGKKGTKVTLTIVRTGENKPLVFEIIRDDIKLKSTSIKKIENTNYAYVRSSTFDVNVTKDVKKGLREFKNLEGIILDLRNNPGGLLDQAVGLTSLFVKSGIVLSEKGKTENKPINVTGKAEFSNIPLVVLVNGGSASASEIVSGALQDHKRAIIVGEQTFGKGSVQQIIPIGNEEALKVTIAQYYLPSGRSIQAVGIKPDILVATSDVPLGSKDTFEIKESDLKRHLKNELLKDENNSNKNLKKDSNDELAQETILKDNQLKTAIDTLKSWNIITLNKK